MAMTSTVIREEAGLVGKILLLWLLLIAAVVVAAIDAGSILDTIADADEAVRLKRIDVRRREVTVVLTVRADTLVVGRIPFFDDLEKLTVSDSTAAPRD